MRRDRHHKATWVVLVAGPILGASALLAITSTSDPSTEGIQRALHSLEVGQYTQAEQQALALATDAVPPAPRAWAIVASSRQRRGQYASAARAHRLFLAAATHETAREYAVQQIQTCEQALQPVRDRTVAAPSRRLSRDDLRRLAEVHDRTYTESSEHFVVQARNSRLARFVAAEAERALDRICRVILVGREYPHSVTINVWPDRRTYRANADDAPEWAGGSFGIVARDGLVTRRIDLTQRQADGQFDTRMLDRVLPHEMCHLVVQEYFGDSTCPLFLNEGLAMLAEAEPDGARAELAAKTLAGRSGLTLGWLLLAGRGDLNQPGVFYAESYSFVEFLRDRLSPQQFRAFLEEVKGGCTVAEALQRALYLPSGDSFLADLAAAWEDHAAAQGLFFQALSGHAALSLNR